MLLTRLGLSLGAAALAALHVGAPATTLVSAPAASSTASSSGPLAGRTVVIDPGHQLGNARFPRQINAPVDAGGFDKPCNTTGTATNAGYPEATFAWKVAVGVRDRLRALGATVIMTRHSNSRAKWGPCVDVRGKIGDRGYRGRTSDADLKLSIHGDGSAAGNHGFHVIVATAKKAESMPYALDTRAALQRAGFVRSTYIGAGTALSVRGDLGTLNWSDMPTVMVELGNMRNAGDARVMRSAAGQRRYATALASAAQTYLSR
ncbi:N-acetylmuramoyl-L-alanine amidase [Nocardioides mangrovicus]|uniref:N-acetylmuramoyl-L-alanine amidase n=1 Tax=Nocardioides mangrovicus TaxID=2478913 RepID=A0A3L8P919_9ACTN|nr:N-acetylmuramoyl-L-alanine amidase [Nocardioides mangrovicus]RLV51118.1 N-acetylmuramoyl-L-alanine amidase [Nocardioides mangrovicus]